MTDSFGRSTVTGKTSRNDSDDLSILAEVVTDLSARAGILTLLLASSRHEELADDRVTVDLDAVAWHTAQAAVARPQPPLQRARLTLTRLAAD
ncbi:MAG: hypothetical protein ACREQ5_29400, partial [Candidatus Dormibacteria bacterium]